jgi:hypothetical protein
LLLTVRNEEGTEVFSQYIELRAATPEHNPRVETVVTLDGISSGERLDVQAELPGRYTDGTYVPGRITSSTFKIIDCKDETIDGETPRGELVHIRIYDESVRMLGDSGVNRCSGSGVSTLSETDE